VIWRCERELQRDPVVEVFYSEYTEALSFLEDAGFTRQEVDNGLVQRIVYSKDEFSVVITLDVRDIAISSSVSVRVHEGVSVGGRLFGLLEDEERADPEIQQLLAQERRYSMPGVYYKAVRERNAELVRPIVRASAELHAAILRKYGRAVLERARKSSA
jgi:hypothetical protein